VACGCALLPLKTRVKGPAAPLPSDQQQDIIDEAITFFRANVLFRNFQPACPADLTLCYLTVLIGETLRACVKCRTKDDAKRSLTSLSMSTQFAIPGDKQFAMPGFFTAPSNKQDADAFRNYFRQAREETVNRVIELAYSAPPVIPTSAPAAANNSNSNATAAVTAPASGGSGSGDAAQNKWWMSFAKRKFMNITAT